MNSTNKALMRSRMKEASQKREKRIDSPLVQYNSVGQPVCRVCNIAIKSESLWVAHIASRQHKEAVEDIKARAKSQGVSSTKSSTTPTVPVPAPVIAPVPAPVPVQVVRKSSALPADFFDVADSKRVRTDTNVNAQATSRINEESKGNGTIPSSNRNDRTGNSAHGILPEGFFDSVDADHRARGLEPPKVDIQEELKEFQKSIQSDLKELESRQEEEEYEAVEEREEMEQIERRALLQRIQALRKQQKKMQKAAAEKKVNFGTPQEMGLDFSSDDDSDEDTLLVDWRAKQL